MKSGSGSGGLIVSFDAISAVRARFPVTAAGSEQNLFGFKPRNKNSGKEAGIFSALLETGQLPFYGI